MFKYSLFLIPLMVSSYFGFNHNITNKQQLLQNETELEVLTKQSLPLAFNSGKFYEWNDSNNKELMLVFSQLLLINLID